jgi:hypothetical protein
VADLDDATESGQSLFVDLLVREELWILEEIAQEPAELPHRFLGTVETSDDRQSRQLLRFNDRETKYVKRFVGVPAELSSIDADEVHAIGNLGTGIAGGFGKAWELAFHAILSSCFGGK